MQEPTLEEVFLQLTGKEVKNEVISLSGRNMKEVYRDPVSVLLGLAMPVALLILFSSIHKKVQLDMFSPQMLTPGIIIFCFAF